MLKKLTLKQRILIVGASILLGGLTAAWDISHFESESSLFLFASIALFVLILLATIPRLRLPALIGLVLIAAFGSVWMIGIQIDNWITTSDMYEPTPLLPVSLADWLLLVGPIMILLAAVVGVIRDAPGGPKLTKLWMISVAAALIPLVGLLGGAIFWMSLGPIW